MIVIQLAALESDFPYSDISENLRLVSRWAVQMMKQQKQHVFVVTSEGAALSHVQTLVRYIKSADGLSEEVDEFLHAPMDSWDVSLLRQVLQREGLRGALTFSDMGSALCVAEGIPFVQLMTGDQSSSFLTLTGLSSHSASFRHLRSAQSLYDLMEVVSQEEALERLERVRQEHQALARSTLSSWFASLS